MSDTTVTTPGTTPTKSSGRPCSICAHPERGVIEGDLAEGRSLRDIAEAHSISAAALHRRRAAGHRLSIQPWSQTAPTTRPRLTPWPSPAARPR
jgi:hypothetical protein